MRNSTNSPIRIFPNRIFRGLAATFVMVLVLRGTLHATAIDEDSRARMTKDREVFGYLIASPPEAVEWAFFQAGPPKDGPRRGARGPLPGGRRPGGPRSFNGPGGPAGEGRPPFPPRLMERLRRMKPDERERVLQRNPRFQELSPERKAELLQRLNMVLEMNNDQRRELDRRLSVFRNLSPEQRRKARQIYEHHWRTLSPTRRMAILDEFRNLRDMSAEERGQRQASEEYQSQFSSEERALLDELSSL